MPKNFVKTTLFLTLLVGIGTSIYLVSQRQILQNKAAGEDWFAGTKYGLALPFSDQEKLNLPEHYPRFAYTLGGDHIQTIMFCTADVTSDCAYLLNGEYELRNADDLTNYIKAHPGDYWTIHNEVELPLPPAPTPEQFANLYYKVYYLVKNADPTAKVFFPGIGTNSDKYKTFVPRTLDAYRQIPKKAGESQTLQTDIWAFHAYPSDGKEGSCANPGVYRDGLTLSEGLVDEFINFAHSIDNGIYQNTPIWITEWGWIHNDAGVHGESEEVNPPCITQYIHDFAEFLETRPIDKIMYFPANYTVTEAPWCDADYHAGVAQPYWHCWSGWLTENGYLTDAGRMYSCMANHDASLCPRFDGENLLTQNMQNNDLHDTNQLNQPFQGPGVYEFSGNVEGKGVVLVDVYDNNNTYLRQYTNGTRFSVNSNEKFFVILRGVSGDSHYRSVRLNKLPNDTPIPTPHKLGDVNNDEVVDAIDLGMVIQSYYTSPVRYPAADLDESGLVDAIDLNTVIQNYYK